MTVRKKALRSTPIALVIALVACSSGGSDTSPATQASTAPVATTTPTTLSPTTTASESSTTTTSAPDAIDAAATTRQLDCTEQLPSYVQSAIPGGGSNPRLSCWAMNVPENYADPDGRRIDVTYYVLESQTPADQRPADPIAYAPGGPRGSAFNTLRIFFNRDVQGDRDLVMMDTRGNSPVPGDDRGIPQSGCPELYDSVLAIFATNDAIETEYEVLADGWRQCLDRLRGEGWDLNQYNTTNVVNDLEQLRMLLGYEKWNFYSESYSTMYALHYMRSHPESLRAVLIDSATPPDGGAWSPTAVAEAVEVVFDAMFDGCAASPECAASYPDLRATFDSVIADLDARPHAVEVEHPLTGERVTVNIDGSDFAFGIGELADASTLPALPGIIQAVANGDRSIIDASAERLLIIADGGLGLSGATVCHDYGADPDRVMNGAADAVAVRRPWQHLGYLSNMPCEVVDVAPAAPGFNDAVVSDVPTLVVIGDLDSATPAADGIATASNLSNATVARFFYESHVPVRTNECARSVTVAFWDDLGDVDLTCVDEANTMPIVFRGAS
jgi:pimeloyl-ACP methyl ester carboxylesterase